MKIEKPRNSQRYCVVCRWPLSHVSTLSLYCSMKCYEDSGGLEAEAFMSDDVKLQFSADKGVTLGHDDHRLIDGFRIMGMAE